jgi:NodT family efflux transporter outer membrane factor (OMF) lipoprotein
VLRSLLDDDAQTLDMVERQFALHYKTRVDVESARSQLAGDRTLLPPLSQQLALARDALAILAGKSPADAPPDDFDLDEFALPETLPVSIPSALVRQRPDIRAAEAQLHAASAAIGVATAQLYPSVTLSASFTQEALTLSTLFGASAEGFLIGSAIAAPLFHGGALEAQQRGAVDAFDAAYANYRQTVLASFGQVADVLQAVDHDAQLLAAEEQAITAAAATLEAARASYAVGRVQILQVLDAQRQLGRARLGYISARAQRYLDTADLFGAMGGAWQDSPTAAQTATP